ncbi:hypothetical protein Tco_0075195, partial [Tanacetum coccineum]
MAGKKFIKVGGDRAWVWGIGKLGPSRLYEALQYTSLGVNGFENLARTPPQEILSDPNDDGTSSDDNDFEDIEYVSIEEVNDVDQEAKEFDLEDILQIQDVILCEKLLNIKRLIANIETLNDNSTPNSVLKSISPFPIPDSNSLFEKSDTSLSYSDNFLPEF